MVVGEQQTSEVKGPLEAEVVDVGIGRAATPRRALTSQRL